MCLLIGNIIGEHNECCVLISKINHHFKYLILVLYYVSVLACDVGLLIVISRNTKIILRILTLFIDIQIISLGFYLGLITSNVSKAAHSPYPTLNTIIANKLVGYKYKMKVISLIDKISGPDIAFTCFEFFPLINYEFYILVVNFIKNFILLIELFEL